MARVKHALPSQDNSPKPPEITKNLNVQMLKQYSCHPTVKAFCLQPPPNSRSTLMTLKLSNALQESIHLLPAFQ